MKKIIIIAVTVILLLSLCACNAVENEEKVIDTFDVTYDNYRLTYNLISRNNENYLVVSSYENLGVTTDTVVVVPTEASLYDIFYSVKAIGNAAFYGKEIYKLTISDGVEEIRAFAVKNTTLLSAVIPASVKTIGDYAFCENTSLTNVNINCTYPPKIGIAVFMINEDGEYKISGKLKLKIPLQNVSYYKDTANYEEWGEYISVISSQ